MTNKSEITEKAKKILAGIPSKEKVLITSTIVDQIKQFRSTGKTSKDGKPLTGLPSRNIGINKYLAERYCSGEAEVAYKLLDLLSIESKSFAVGYSRFGSLLYLPSDYTGTAGGGDFAALLAARK